MEETEGTQVADAPEETTEKPVEKSDEETSNKETTDEE